jgi:superfamily II DNA or RNA helicase
MPQLDLFGDGSSSRVSDVVNSQSWPGQNRFPTNRAMAHVRDSLWADLSSSQRPLLTVGYSSISEIVELIASWGQAGNSDAQLRIVFGSEPFGSTRPSFRSARIDFTDEARRYWLEECGISLLLSAKVVLAITAIESGIVQTRFIHGSRRLHAKVYVGDNAATLGSSNFTNFGLSQQYEANARFELPAEHRRYAEVAEIGENFWAAGETWNQELLGILRELLKMVTWQEALARACAELLEGGWASRYLNNVGSSSTTLWPSQKSGIAEALWVIQNVGSVLVADATGSGKTKMGAHLVRATRDRLWSTGRVRRDLTVLVGPPAVVDVWEREALEIGLGISKVSHGLLSRSGHDGHQREELAVRGAQILAVDEAHNFLNNSSTRTQKVRESLADNVLLFTATPISRGASDLLNLVGLLGPDNFDDATLEILKRLERRRGLSNLLSIDEVHGLRKEIQRFTVRRTKDQINEMVDRSPGDYVHPLTNRICRYPAHQSQTYVTGETIADEETADTIRRIADGFLGIAQLEDHIEVPQSLRYQYTDEQWLQFRLRSGSGLSRHHVLEALRSSRAAILEHVSGTKAAAERFGLNPRFKPADTGDMLTKLATLGDRGPPRVDLACNVPDWLREVEAWQIACSDEIRRYGQIRDQAILLTPAREEAKATQLIELCRAHSKVLVFERHPITLAVFEAMLKTADLGATRVLVATSKKGQRESVMHAFAPHAGGQAIALCSDAMNEGLNLQGASCLVHLDLPTTLRVAEQRVGRVDRMDSPHDIIEVWWPKDGPSFATRAYEALVQRAKESESLLGSNLQIPDFNELENSAILAVETIIQDLDEPKPEPWDGIRDALDPVRRIANGPNALVSASVYDEYRDTGHRVVSRVAPVRSKQSWAFFAISAASHGAPRWMLLDSDDSHKCITDLGEVAERLRELLAENPVGRELDEATDEALSQFIEMAKIEERRLLPRRMQRALVQMSVVLDAWSSQARRNGDESRGADWKQLSELTSTRDSLVDPYLVAEGWLTLVAPVLESHREQERRSRYILLKDIQKRLIEFPLPYSNVVEAFTSLPISIPLDRRISSCIIGIPDSA